MLVPSVAIANCKVVDVSAVSSPEESSSPSTSEEKYASDDASATISVCCSVSVSPASWLFISLSDISVTLSEETAAPVSLHRTTLTLPDTTYDICETVFPLPELPEELPLLLSVVVLLPAETLTL